MNRQTAVGMLNGKISGEGSGGEERPRRTKSNKSLNPTRDSMALKMIAYGED
jgi:hypothetical protein